MLLFMLLSIPLAVFCAWFARQAWKVGKRQTAIGMAVLALVCLVAGALSAGWMWLLVQR